MKSVERMSDARGTIRAIDPRTRTVTIEGLVLKKTFQVAEDARIATKENRRAALGDFKVGDQVEILYEEEGPSSIAHCITHPGVLDASRMQDLRKAA